MLSGFPSLEPISEIDGEKETDLNKRKRRPSSDISPMTAASTAYASPLLASDISAMAEDLGLLELPSSALATGSVLIGVAAHACDPDDVTETTVSEQHKAWQTKLKGILHRTSDPKQVFILTTAVGNDPKQTLRTVMGLSSEQVRSLDGPARELVDDLRTRVLERLRSLTSGMPAPQRSATRSQTPELPVSVQAAATPGDEQR